MKRQLRYRADAEMILKLKHILETTEPEPLTAPGQRLRRRLLRHIGKLERIRLGMRSAWQLFPDRRRPFGATIIWDPEKAEQLHVRKPC